MEYAMRSAYGINHLNYIPTSKWAQCSLPAEVAKECKNLKLLSISGHTLRPIAKYIESDLFDSIVTIRDPTERYVSEFIYRKYKGFSRGSLKSGLMIHYAKIT
jgi:hypothetical protein